jgi:exopolysaccharide production protein ExoZ
MAFSQSNAKETQMCPAPERPAGGCSPAGCGIVFRRMLGQDNPKNEGLQAARAIAALSVAYFHSYVAVRAAFPETAWAPIPFLRDWGGFGVNFFFAISGYVICVVVSKPEFTLRGFVIKRVFRLYPMYWAVMAIVALMIAAGNYRPEPLTHFLYSTLLLPQQHAPAYDLSWTLEREMVFYALAAITVPIAGIYGLAATLAALAFGGWWFENPWSFHLLSTTQADFLAGVLIFAANPILRRLGAIVPLAAGATLLWYSRSHDFAFSVTLSMALLLTGMVNLRLPWSRLPFRWAIAAGNASYSIYLLHYLVFFQFAVWSVTWPLPDWMCEPWRIAAILVCSLLSYGTWQVIEEPMNRMANSLVRNRWRPSHCIVQTKLPTASDG